MKRNLAVKILLIFVLFLIYGICFSQYLIISNRYSEALNLNIKLRDTLSELKVQYERLTNLKVVEERAINELHMHYASDSDKLIVKDEE